MAIPDDFQLKLLVRISPGESFLVRGRGYLPMLSNHIFGTSNYFSAHRNVIDDIVDVTAKPPLERALKYRQIYQNQISFSTF